MAQPTLTSEDSPLRVAFVQPELHGGRGMLGLTFAPGKRHQGLEVVWERDLQTDLRRLREVYRTDLLVSLIEDHELPLLRIEGLFDRASELGIETLRLPIRDGSIPASPAALASLVRQVAAALAAGRNVVVHCRGGLGRAGLVTAAILVGHGVEPRQAIAEVRRVRPGAIENRLQEEFVERFAGVWSGGAGRPRRDRERNQQEARRRRSELAELRRLALSLPDATEEDHHGRPSFRVHGKIFATVPDEEHLHVMLGPEEVGMAVDSAPGAFAELWWGKRLSGVRVTLAAADPDMVAAALVEAWRLKAPRRLVREFDGSQSSAGPSSKEGA